MKIHLRGRTPPKGQPTSGDPTPRSHSAAKIARLARRKRRLVSVRARRDWLISKRIS